MIQFDNVSKTYEDSDTHALNGTTLNINDGEFVFIVGPSGAGKSTLLKLIMREQLPTEGDIIIDGQVINKLKRREVPYFRRKMGMVYQDFRLIDKMNVFDNVAFAMRVIGASSSQIKSRVTGILKLVGLEHKIKVRPSQLSGGERQRVSLARAIANNPKILIADEPTANVDATMSYEIISLLKKINKLGTTVLIVTHDRELVNQFGGRIIEINKGRVVADSGVVATEKEESTKASKNPDATENIKAVENIQRSENTADNNSAVNSVDEIVNYAVSEVSNEIIEEQHNNHESNVILKNINPKDSSEQYKAKAEKINNNTENNAKVIAEEQQEEPDTSKYDDLIEEIKAEQDKKTERQ